MKDRSQSSHQSNCNSRYARRRWPQRSPRVPQRSRSTHDDRRSKTFHGNLPERRVERPTLRSQILHQRRRRLRRTRRPEPLCELPSRIWSQPEARRTWSQPRKRRPTKKKSQETRTTNTLTVLSPACLKLRQRHKTFQRPVESYNESYNIRYSSKFKLPNSQRKSTSSLHKIRISNNGQAFSKSSPADYDVILTSADWLTIVQRSL